MIGIIHFCPNINSCSLTSNHVSILFFLDFEIMAKWLLFINNVECSLPWNVCCPLGFTERREKSQSVSFSNLGFPEILALTSLQGWEIILCLRVCPSSVSFRVFLTRKTQREKHVCLYLQHCDNSAGQFPQLWEFYFT